MLQFMFRTRRTNLSRKLLKARKTIDGVVNNNCQDVHRLLRRLHDNQLAMLWKAVESRGKDHSNNCILVHKDQFDTSHLISCQNWRWPDLVQDTELRRMPGCRSICDPVYICCNPYHWSRIHQPEIPPPPYSRCPTGRLITEDDECCEEDRTVPFHGSMTTNGSDTWRDSPEWCKLAYWELAQRVGPFFPVESSAVNIFGNLPFGDGLSLEMLAQHNENATESVRHARCKIGLGVTLSHEGGGHIWLYNRSDNPIFVNSLTLDCNNESLPTRVPAERCLCIYDPAKAAQLLENGWTPRWTPSAPVGPVDPKSIRISFAKGWGPRYSRQEITACPCWLEVLLAPCR